MSAHGRVLYLPDPGCPGGERFEIRLDLDELPALPATSPRSHDAHLWAHNTQWHGCVEVWLHHMTFTAEPLQHGARWGHAVRLRPRPIAPHHP
ncbi:hypothetical protein OHA04_39095 [Streptomyces sp. NBC_01590]|uniref:hypothetical protein n=1 Tax=Streptomyces sp. NBC_01590 TaxID=2975887 RepID=UPI00386D3ABA